MKSLTSLVPLALLTAPVVLAGSPQKCSTNSITPCSCPDGSEYAQSVTFAVIGAKAVDVRDVMSDFFNTSWFGSMPSSTQGPDNTPGSTRNYTFVPPTQSSGVSEKLTELQVRRDGSFIQKFEMVPSSVPVQFPGANGTITGYWATIESQFVFQYETAITYSVYACQTGYGLDFAAFHESALKNVTSILRSEGKILGTNVNPFSIQSF